MNYIVYEIATGTIISYKSRSSSMPIGPLPAEFDYLWGDDLVEPTPGQMVDHSTGDVVQAPIVEPPLTPNNPSVQSETTVNPGDTP